MGYQELYKQKLVTAEEAVKVVKSGQWIDYGFCANHPVALDKALAARMEAEPDLTHLNFRGGIALWVPAVTQVTDAPMQNTPTPTPAMKKKVLTISIPDDGAENVNIRAVANGKEIYKYI